VKGFLDVNTEKKKDNKGRESFPRAKKEKRARDEIGKYVGARVCG
jgi:hypothetical protein